MNFIATSPPSPSSRILTLIYTFEGGIAAVIWTDVVQTGDLCRRNAGRAVSPSCISFPADGPPSIRVAVEAGKFRVFDFAPNFYKTYTFWAGLIGGAFLTTASHGTDQLIVQRLLAARSSASVQAGPAHQRSCRALPVRLFLLVGAMLFVFYRLYPSAVAFGKTDRIYPTFIVTQMPHGISGLLIAAILAAAMSNLSAALNSLSSTSMVDFYLQLRPQSSEQRRVFLSRIATVAWGMVLFGLAILSRSGGKVVEMGLSIASVAYGALLGVFLLGVLTRKASESGAMLGMLCGFLTNLYIWKGREALTWLQFHTGLPLGGLALSRDIPFTWYVALGSAVTFAVGYAASLFMTVRSHPEPAPDQTNPACKSIVT